MINALDASSRRHLLTYKKLGNKNPAQTDCKYYFLGLGCEAAIDPNQLPGYKYPTTDGGDGCMTTERVIAHEIAHAYDQHKRETENRPNYPHSVIIKIENDVMRQVDPLSPDRTPDDDRLYR
jgi:hypothetical protein